MATTKPRCDQCYWWKNVTNDMRGAGFCHYNAPSCGSRGDALGFALTLPHQFCRQWTHKDAEPFLGRI